MEEPIKPSSTLTDRAGWISPEGQVYHCYYYEHTDFAERILAVQYPTVEEYGYDAQRHLEKSGWIHLNESGHWTIYTELTQAQIDVLDDLSHKGTYFGKAVAENLQHELGTQLPLPDLINEPLEAVQVY